MFLLTTPSNQLHLEKEKNMKHSMSAQIFSLLLAVLFVFCGIPAIAAEPQQESTDQVVSGKNASSLCFSLHYLSSSFPFLSS